MPTPPGAIQQVPVTKLWQTRESAGVISFIAYHQKPILYAAAAAQQPRPADPERHDTIYFGKKRTHARANVWGRDGSSDMKGPPTKTKEHGQVRAIGREYNNEEGASAVVGINNFKVLSTILAPQKGVLA